MAVKYGESLSLMQVEVPKNDRMLALTLNR